MMSDRDRRATSGSSPSASGLRPKALILINFNMGLQAELLEDSNCKFRS